MFQNSYQNGTFFEVFDPKFPQDKTKNLYKLQNMQPNHKVFDKGLKTFVYEFMNSTSKITFPKEDKKQLYLIQQHLNLHIEFISAEWHIELTVSDLTRTKRRLIISPAFQKVEKKPFFLKFPCPPMKHGGWSAICIDLYSFIEGFKGQTYRSLDSIQIMGSFRLRRIFTTNFPVTDSEQSNSGILLPKNMTLPMEIEVENYYIKFEEEENSQHINESTSKYSSNFASSKNISKEVCSKKQIAPKKEIMSKRQVMSKKEIISKKQIPEKKEFLSKKELISKKELPKQGSKISMEKQSERTDSPDFKHIEIVNTFKQDIQDPVIQTNTACDEKKFLANTNGLEVLKNKKDSMRNDSINQSTVALTPLSTGKNLKRRRELSKTHLPDKNISIEKKQKEKTVKIAKQASPSKKQSKGDKLNPWRQSISKKHETGRCEGTKMEDFRKIQSAEASLFKTRNNLGGKQNQMKCKAFDKNSECSRQSDYFELSQKFSTVTQGRFLKNQQLSKIVDQEKSKQAEDEIQQKIEVQSTSFHSTANMKISKNKQNLCSELQQKPIEQSINDSLDCFAKNNNKSIIKERLTQNESYCNMTSRNGFGEKMMNKFMKQLQRPYSPPLGERQQTEQNESEVKERCIPNSGVELMYDPVLNCYYDHKTHTYYELKN